MLLYFCIERKELYVRSWYITNREKYTCEYIINTENQVAFLKYVEQEIQIPCMIYNNELIGDSLTYDNYEMIKSRIKILSLEFTKFNPLLLYISKSKKLVISAINQNDVMFKESCAKFLTVLIPVVMLPNTECHEYLQYLKKYLDDGNWTYDNNSIYIKLSSDTNINEVNVHCDELDLLIVYVKLNYEKYYNNYLKTKFKPYKFADSLNVCKEEIVDTKPSMVDELILMNYKLNNIEKTLNKLVKDDNKVISQPIDKFDISKVNLYEVNIKLEKLINMVGNINNYNTYDYKLNRFNYDDYKSYSHKRFIKDMLHQ